MTTTKPITRFQILDRAAPAKGKWGGYRRVAVVEVDPAQLPEGAHEPLSISDRARGLVRIVEVWDQVHRGGPKSAYGQAIAAAEALVAKLEADRAKAAKTAETKARRAAAFERLASGDSRAVVLADAMREVGEIKSEGGPASWTPRERKAFVDGLELADALGMAA